MQETRFFDSGRAVRGRLGYLLHLPPAYGAEPQRKWPLILFLHGVRERGNDPQIVARHGVARVALEQPDFPFVVISPQCAADTMWNSYARAIRLLLDDVMGELAIDPDRLFLTGLSMGGYATWHLATDHPDLFAAIAPVCGGGLRTYGFPARVCTIRHLPVWAFHGARDDVVPPSESIRLVEELRRCDGHVRFTLYPDLAHDSWTRTYANPELYRWFLSHRLGEPGPRDVPPGQ